MIPEPTAQVGDDIQVIDDSPVLGPWPGTIHAVKWSSLTGWWYDVESRETGTTWTVPERLISKEE